MIGRLLYNSYSLCHYLCSIDIGFCTPPINVVGSSSKLSLNSTQAVDTFNLRALYGPFGWARKVDDRKWKSTIVWCGEMCENGKGAKWCFLLNPPKTIIPIWEGKCEEKMVFLNEIYYFVILNYNLFYHLLNPNVIKV